jgi:hypothetical protein
VSIEISTKQVVKLGSIDTSTKTLAKDLVDKKHKVIIEDDKDPKQKKNGQSYTKTLVKDLVDKKLQQFFDEKHEAIIEDDEDPKQKKNGQSYKISDLYQKKYVDLIKGKLRDNFIKLCGGDDNKESSDKNKKDIEDQLIIAKKIFDERSDNVRCWKNVKRQEYEIRRFELKPGEIKLDNLMTQMADNMTFVNENGDPVSNKNGNVSPSTYGGDEVEARTYIVGSPRKLESQIDRIKYRDNALIHTSRPSKNYRNIVFDTRVSVLDDIKINDNRLRVFLEEGRGDLTPEERADIKTRSRAWNRVSNNFEELGETFHQITEWAGRGVLSSSKASDNKIYKDFLTRRNELISNMLWKAGPNAQDGSFYLKVLNKVNNALAGSDDIMDQATFQKMQKLITDEIRVEDTVLKAELDAFNKKLNDMNDSMLKGLQNHVDEDDRLWKYRCLQIFLLLTPLGAFSIAGQVFSYIDPLMELIGPLFDAGKTLGEGLGDMASSDVLGPFGKIAEAFRINDGIQFFFDKTPIVSDLCEIFDFITDNDLAQNVLGAASPLQYSPIALLAPAGLISFFRAGAEIMQYQKISAYQEAQQKALETIFKEFEKGRESGFEKDANGNIIIATKDFKNGKHPGLEDRVKKFSANRMAILKEANLDAELLRFVSDPDNEDKLADLFDGLKFEIKKDAVGNTAKYPMSEILEKCGDKKKFFEIFCDVNSDAKKEAMDRFLLFSAIQDSGKPFYDNLAAFHKEQERPKDDDKKKLYDKSIKVLNEKFIAESAKKLNITNAQKQREIEEISKKIEDKNTDPRDKKYLTEQLEKSKTELCKILEKELIAHDTRYLFDLAKTRIPNGAISKPKATHLTNDEHLFRGM